MKTKNVLMLCNSYYPLLGGEKYYQKVAEKLAEIGYKVTVWTPRKDKSHDKAERVNGVSIQRFESRGLLGIWSFMARNIGKIISADIIHGFDFNTILFWYFPFRIIFWHKPVFVTFLGHEGIFPIPEKIILTRKLTELITWGNICGGHYIKKWYSTAPDYIVYGGCEKPKIERPAPSEASAVFIGRIQKDSGISEYIKAVCILNERGVKMKMDIFGNIKDKQLYDDLQKIILDKGLHVKYCGIADNTEETIQRYRYAFLSACLANLEAMICKRLIFSIYSNPLKKDYLEMVPGAKEMTEIAGEPEMLAEKIIYHIDHPETDNAMVKNAYEYANAQTWENAARKHKLLFDKTKPQIKLVEVLKTSGKLMRAQIRDRIIK